jgi:hypothetical protein
MWISLRGILASPLSDFAGLIRSLREKQRPPLTDAEAPRYPPLKWRAPMRLSQKVYAQECDDIDGFGIGTMGDSQKAFKN